MTTEAVLTAMVESGPVALDHHRETYESVMALQGAGKARFLGRLRDWNGEYVVMAMRTNQERG